MSLDPESRAAAERCFTCPKMCRFSCPVSLESSRETLTPGGKMTLASLTVPDASRGRSLPGPLAALARRAKQLVAPGAKRELDADTAEAFWGCTGCLRCRTWCEHENDVPKALTQARAYAVEQGLAPAAATLVADLFQRQGHAAESGLREALDRLANELPANAASTTVLFAGCEAPMTSPQSIRSTAAAARRLGAPLGVAREPMCCGRPLLEAGRPDAFRKHVAQTWSQLGDREVVTGSAACARALDEWAREHGVEPRGPVVHTSVYLARRLGPDVQAKPLEGTVSYHDPCHLVRGLGESEAPRRLLRAAVGGDLIEPQSTLEEANCCGASGLVPRTFPQLARAMAMTRADEMRKTGATRVATACPACRGALAGAGLDVVDVAELVDEWLGQDAQPSGESS